MRNFDFRRVFIIVILAFMGVMCVMICLHFGDVVKEVPFADYVANMRFIGGFRDQVRAVILHTLSV